MHNLHVSNIMNFMKSTITKTTYQAIYRLLDRVSPVDFDCGILCGAACCLCDYIPEDIPYTADGDENADSYMGLMLLPGEEAEIGVEFAGGVQVPLCISGFGVPYQELKL